MPHLVETILTSGTRTKLLDTRLLKEMRWRAAGHFTGASNCAVPRGPFHTNAIPSSVTARPAADDTERTFSAPGKRM